MKNINRQDHPSQCGVQLKWWSHSSLFSHSSGHFLFPSLPLVWTSDQAITTRMYWNHVFSAVEQAQCFCWLDISETLKSCRQQFQMVTTTNCWLWWCWGRGRRRYPGPAQAPPTQTALGLFDGWCLIPDSILNGRELHHPRNPTPTTHSANYKINT